MDDVVVSETSHRIVQSNTLMTVGFAAVLLFGVASVTWAIVRSLHTRIDRLSDHISAQSVRKVEGKGLGLGPHSGSGSGLGLWRAKSSRSAVTRAKTTCGHSMPLPRFEASTPHVRL